jgi:DNA-binding transcriptional LysR family regulator
MIDKFSGDFLQWLRGFFFAAQFGSVSRAAKHMGLIQSAVSHQIKNLEKELNVVLFQRENKEMVLTPEGALLLKKTIPLFERVQEIVHEVGRKEGELSGQVRLVANHAIGYHFLPEVIRGFVARHPKVRFELIGGGFAFAVDMVENARTDLSIVNLYDFPDSIEYTGLFDSKLMLAGPPGNPFGLPMQCTLEDAASRPFLSFPLFGTVETVLNGVLRQRGLALNKVFVANNFSTLLKYVEMGLGVTILDEFALTNPKEQVEVYPLEDQMPLRRYVIIARKGRHLPPQVAAFRDALLVSAPPAGCKSIDQPI